MLVKTDPKAEPAHHGMSLILIEKGPGFSVVRKLDKLGYRGIDTAELVFEDCRVPRTSLIGVDEGQGLQQILAGLELGRINIAARGVGIARACLDESDVIESLAKGQSRSFWVVLHADNEAVPGLRRGKIRISADRAGALEKSTTEIDLEIRVRPFQLQRARIPFGAYFYVNWSPAPMR